MALVMVDTFMNEKVEDKQVRELYYGKKEMEWLVADEELKVDDLGSPPEEFKEMADMIEANWRVALHTFLPEECYEYKVEMTLDAENLDLFWQWVKESKLARSGAELTIEQNLKEKHIPILSYPQCTANEQPPLTGWLGTS
jgi:hypothetical protein